MSFHNFAQPTSSEGAELANFMHDDQQFDQSHSFTMPEAIIASEKAELENVMDDDQQFDQLHNLFTVKEEIVDFDENINIEPNYSTLLSMFPNVDSKYIRQICMNPPFDKNEDNSLVMLINHLLSYDEKIDETFISELHEEQNKTTAENALNEEQLLHIIEEEEQEKNATMNDKILSEMLEIQEHEAREEQKRSEQLLNEHLFTEFLEQDKTAIDEKIEILENILPDADPNILREFVEKNDENVNSIDEFVESNLKNKNYKKRDEYYAKLRTKEKIEQYTIGFNVEQFIKQFPEPIEYFENPERKGTKQEKALNFLINRYNFDAIYIENIYTSTKYNLSLADKHLQIISGVNPITKYNIQFDDIPLLQEIAYIENKACIREYIELIREKEEKEMRLLRIQKLLLECQCCYDDVKPTECIECDNNHIFCKKCVIKGTDLALSNGQMSVNCFMGTGCTSEFSLNELRRILAPNTFDIFLNKRQEFEIKTAKLDGLVSCPFCPYSMELASQIQIFICKNPECMKITCRLCKRMNHLPIKCEDVLDEHKSRLYVEEEMSKELIRYCQRCNTPFVKKGGCNHMTCRCGASMCYICKRSWDYPNDHSQCRENSDVFETEQVELRRLEAITKLRADFPDLQLPDV